MGHQTSNFLVISKVIADYAHHPEAASLLQKFRSELNWTPTQMAIDYLQTPGIGYSDLARVMPTETPFPQALELVSNIMLGAQTIISQDLGYLPRPTYTPPPATGDPLAVTAEGTPGAEAAPASTGGSTGTGALMMPNSTTASAMAMFTGAAAAVDRSAAMAAVAFVGGAVGMAML